MDAHERTGRPGVILSKIFAVGMWFSCSAVLVEVRLCVTAINLTENLIESEDFSTKNQNKCCLVNCLRLQNHPFSNEGKVSYY